MINESLIIPTEAPVSESDVKRALMTYDKVYIPSPDDRELIPPNTYFAELMKTNRKLMETPGGAQIATIVGGMHVVPSVKPLGKVDGYDDAMTALAESCKPLIQAGKMEILSTPQYEQQGGIGVTIPMPIDTPDPQFTFHNYRNLIANAEYVTLMSSGLEHIDLKKVKDISALSPSGVEDEDTTYFGNRIPKATLPGIIDPEENRILSKICHARLGTMVKFLMYCNNKNITPFTTDPGIAKVINKLEINFVGTLNQIQAEKKKSRLQQCINALENLVFEEFIDKEKLEGLSINEIMRLRTRAWGKAYEGKNQLIKAIKEVAHESDYDIPRFRTAMREKVKEYLQAIQDYQNEMQRIKLSVTWDAVGLVASGSAGTALYDAIIRSPNIQSLIVLGGLAGLAIAKDFKDQLFNFIDLIDKQSADKQLPGYAIYSNYKYVM